MAIADHLKFEEAAALPHYWLSGERGTAATAAVDPGALFMAAGTMRRIVTGGRAHFPAANRARSPRTGCIR